MTTPRDQIVNSTFSFSIYNLMVSHLKVSQPGVSEGTFSVLESSCHQLYLQSNHSKVETIPFKFLIQGHNKRTCEFFLHAIPSMLNVMQWSC